MSALSEEKVESWFLHILLEFVVSTLEQMGEDCTAQG
jgi:hypothetical protein